MEFTGLILGVLGVVLAVVFAPPVWRALELYMAELRSRVWSAHEYRHGRLEHRRHFGFEAWSVRIAVNDQGDTTQAFSARLVNLSQKLVSVFYLPFFSDGLGLSVDTLKPWAKSGQRPLRVEFETLESLRSQGRIAIFHEPPVRPGERRRLSWGITLPQVFSEGDDYYDWDVEVPHYQMNGSIEFSSNWQVLYARWDVASPDYLEPPDFDDRSIRWRVSLPKIGTRLHLVVGLRKSER